jgi:general stress protein 26
LQFSRVTARAVGREIALDDKTDSRERLYELLEHFDTAMLVTRGADGHMHARPMAVADLRANADTYLVTSIESPKVDEIERNSDVTLTFQDGNCYATLCGHVEIIRDRAVIERLWKEPWKVWFPQGKDDPSIAVLRFDADHGEYWDNSGARGLKYAFEAAKAYVKGETPQTDRAQHSRLHL